MAIYTGSNWGDPPEGTILQCKTYTISGNTQTHAVYRSGTQLMALNFTQKFSNSQVRIDFQCNHSMQGNWDGTHWGFYRDGNFIQRFGNIQSNSSNVPNTMALHYTYGGANDTNTHAYQVWMFDANNDGGNFKMGQPSSGTGSVSNIADFCNNTFYELTLMEIAQ